MANAVELRNLNQPVEPHFASGFARTSYGCSLDQQNQSPACQQVYRKQNACKHLKTHGSLKMLMHIQPQLKILKFSGPLEAVSRHMLCHVAVAYTKTIKCKGTIYLIEHAPHVFCPQLTWALTSTAYFPCVTHVKFCLGLLVAHVRASYIEIQRYGIPSLSSANISLGYSPGTNTTLMSSAGGLPSHQHGTQRV